MKRQLGAIETALSLTAEFGAFNVVVVLRLERGPSLEALRSALDRLIGSHPMLELGIHRETGRHVFESQSEPELRLEAIEREGDDHWLRVTEEELNRRLEVEAAPLMWCRYLSKARAEGACEIILTFHHAIMDGTAAFLLLDQLLRLCDAASKPFQLPEVELPPAAEERFPSGFKGMRAKGHLADFMVRQIADELSYRFQVRGTRLPPVHDTARCRVEVVQLDEEHTRQLVKRSRRERVTLNAAASAAMLTAVSRHLYSGRRLPMRYFTFADLRPYLEPPVPVEGLGCFITPMRFTIEVDPGRGFWALASDITSQVYRASQRGAKYCSTLMSPTMMRTVLGQRRFRMGTSAVSYTGVAKLEKTYGELEVRDLHAFVSNISLGPEYTAQARMAAGKLWWDIVWMDIDMDRGLARTIADEMLAVLRGAAAGE